MVKLMRTFSEKQHDCSLRRSLNIFAIDFGLAKLPINAAWPHTKRQQHTVNS